MKMKCGIFVCIHVIYPGSVVSVVTDSSLRLLQRVFLKIPLKDCHFPGTNSTILGIVLAWFPTIFFIYVFVYFFT